MGVAVAERNIGVAADIARCRVIDLGNGVMFPVKNDDEAKFVEWMVEEAKAGRATLPKNAPRPLSRPTWLDTDPKMSSEEFWAFYEEERGDRF